MSDLTYEVYFHCSTAENFEVEVIGSKGDKYKVRWNYIHHKNREKVENDWSCTCPDYQYGKGEYCKHIKKVIDSNQRCGWMEFSDGGKAIMENGMYVCPKCGNIAHAKRHIG